MRSFGLTADDVLKVGDINDGLIYNAEFAGMCDENLRAGIIKNVVELF